MKKTATTTAKALDTIRMPNIEQPMPTIGAVALQTETKLPGGRTRIAINTAEVTRRAEEVRTREAERRAKNARPGAAPGAA